MLVGRRRRGVAWLGIALMLLPMLSLAPYLRSGTEVARARNALVFDDQRDAAVEWTPATMPADFLLDRVPPDAFFGEVAQRLDLAAMPDDWARAVAISRHLLGSSPVLLGRPIQSNLAETYRRITTRGEGYCVDFVKVFSAIAIAAGIPVRSWAFSFDGFGGHGHVLPEIWNRQAKQWQMLDVFDNSYFRTTGEPLSAKAFREAMLADDPQLRLLPLHAGARPGYIHEEKAWAYYRRGLSEWYLWWGTNPFTYEQSWSVRHFSPLSRSLAQVGAMVQGVHPHVHVLIAADNQEEVQALRNVRRHLFVSLWLFCLGAVLLLWAQLTTGRGARADGPPGTLAEGDEARLRVCVVGPLPPPPGGMANQCEQLVRLLQSAGTEVGVVRTNADYRPAIVGRVPIVRAGFRLLPYLLKLWRTIGQADVVHVFANSGWAWHLCVLPALLVCRLRGVRVIINYRGGNAERFFSQAPRHVLNMLARASLRVTPSAYLLRVFRKHGLDAEVIPNIIDLSRFQPSGVREPGNRPHLVVTRHLEEIYDIPTAIRAFSRIVAVYPEARLTIAGTGPELEKLQALVTSLGLTQNVTFAGRIAHGEISALYAQADCMLNPSAVDNMPISILEAFASGVPVVSTDAGGIPDMVEQGVSGLLVPIGDDAAMAERVLEVLRHQDVAQALRQAGLHEARRYDWPQVSRLWLDAYRRVASGRSLG